MNRLNDFLSQLRIAGIILFVIGIGMLVNGVLEGAARSAPREHIYALEDFELSNRQYLDCVVDAVVDNYAETTEETKNFGVTTSERDFSQHYIIPCYDEAGELRFVSAEVTYAPYIDEFNAILEQTYSEEYDEENPLYFEFEGRVDKLDSELVDFAYETMLYYEIVTDRADFNSVFLPYSIRVVAPGAYNSTSSLIIGIVTLVLGAGLFVVDLEMRKRRAAKIAQAQFNEDNAE
jgi:hypothetical protein